MAHVGMLYVYRSFWPFCINLSTFVGSLISFIGMVKGPDVSQCKFIHLKSVIDTAGLCKSPSLQCVLRTSLCLNSVCSDDINLLKSVQVSQPVMARTLYGCATPQFVQQYSSILSMFIWHSNPPSISMYVLSCSQWRIYDPKFSQFHAVFRKIWQNHMLAIHPTPPPSGGLAPPPTGNPGSAPDFV